MSNKSAGIPNGWLQTTIGEFSPLQRGFDLPSQNREDGDYPVVYSNGILNTHKDFKVEGPGIVTGRSGTLGKVHFIESDFWAHNTTLWVTNFNNAHPKFVYYLLDSIGFERFSSGSGVPTLNRNDAHEFKVSVPVYFYEQQKIAQALSDTDAYISSLEKLIEKKKMLKDGLMANLLTGKQRLKEFALKEDGSEKGYKESDLGLIPEDWEIVNLQKVLTVGHGKPQFSIEKENGKYPILATGGILGFTDQFLYDKPSVLIGRKGTIDKPQYMDTPFWTVDTLFYTIINSKYHPKFLFYKFYLIDWRRKSEASGVPSLSSNIIYQQYMSIPKEIEEQEKISQVISNVDLEIFELEKRLKKNEVIKQGMMQKLLTGEIRLV